MADRKAGAGSKGGSAKGSQGKKGQPAKGGKSSGKVQPRGVPAASPSRLARGASGGQRRAVRDLPPVPAGPRETPRLRVRFDDEIKPQLVRDFTYKSVMQAPVLSKVVVNIGLGEALTNANAMQSAVADLEAITGQKVVVTVAKKSISQFRLRKGQQIGCMVTLRGARMYDFIDKLFNVALPRVRDFTGVSPDSFDGRGNYTLGLREQLIFPEIQYDEIDRLRGMEVVIVTTANTDAEGRRLLELLGMPFRKDQAAARVSR
jgi:large subunit ribosomal protein L5